MSSVPEKGKRYDAVYIQQKVNEAVANLNFEEADRLTRLWNDQVQDDLTSTRIEIENEQESQRQKLQRYADKQERRIESETELKLLNTVKQYQDLYKQLKANQDREVTQLQQTWIKTHEDAVNVARNKIDNLLYTSKVLASCECYDNAKTLRNKVHEEEDTIVNKETKAIDKHFKKQFERMLERQQAALDSLYKQMKNDLESIRGQSNIAKVAVRSHEKINLAMSPMNSIHNISLLNNFTMDQKKSLIADLTPTDTRGDSLLQSPKESTNTPNY